MNAEGYNLLRIALVMVADAILMQNKGKRASLVWKLGLNVVSNFLLYGAHVNCNQELIK